MFVRLLITLALSIALGSCDQVKTTHLISFEMYGVQVAPDTASGDESPLNQTYTIEEVSFISSDGSTEKVLLSSANQKEYVIVARRQIIFSVESKELDGESFSSVVVKFSPTVTGENYDDNIMTTTLSNPSYTLTEDFSVNSTDDIVFSIKVQWANTVQDTVMSEPNLVLAKDE